MDDTPLEIRVLVFHLLTDEEGVSDRAYRQLRKLLHVVELESLDIVVNPTNAGRYHIPYYRQDRLMRALNLSVEDTDDESTTEG